MDKTIQPAMLTAEEGHALVGKDKISRGSFYSALRRNDIPNIRIGKRVLIPRDAFMRWLEAGSAREAPTI
jgi:excisionase family DNA binding protein